MITRPDEYRHENESYAIVDINNVRGGVRLYDSLNSAKNAIILTPDLFKLNQTLVIIKENDNHKIYVYAGGSDVFLPIKAESAISGYLTLGDFNVELFKYSNSNGMEIVFLQGSPVGSNKDGVYFKYNKNQFTVNSFGELLLGQTVDFDELNQEINYIKNNYIEIGLQIPANMLPSYIDDVVELMYFSEEEAELPSVNNYEDGDKISVGGKVYTRKTTENTVIPEDGDEDVDEEPVITINTEWILDVDGEIVYNPVKGKIYIDKNTNKTYRWSGSQYIIINNPDDKVDKNKTTVIAGKDAEAAMDGGVAIGQNAKSEHEESIAIGMDSTAHGSYSVAIGGKDNGEKGANADGYGSIALGYQSSATGEQSISEGGNSRAGGAGCVSIGYNSNSTTQGGLSIGYNAYSNGDGDVAIGPESQSDGYGSVSVGYHSYSRSQASVALGAMSEVGYSGVGSVQLGQGTNNTAGTLQFRDYPLVDANGKIYKDRLPENIPTIEIDWDWNNSTESVIKGRITPEQYNIFKTNTIVKIDDTQGFTGLVTDLYKTLDDTYENIIEFSSITLTADTDGVYGFGGSLLRIDDNSLTCEYYLDQKYFDDYVTKEELVEDYYNKEKVDEKIGFSGLSYRFLDDINRLIDNSLSISETRDLYRSRGKIGSDVIVLERTLYFETYSSTVYYNGESLRLGYNPAGLGSYSMNNAGWNVHGKVVVVGDKFNWYNSWETTAPAGYMGCDREIAYGLYKRWFLDQNNKINIINITGEQGTAPIYEINKFSPIPYEKIYYLDGKYQYWNGSAFVELSEKQNKLPLYEISTENFDGNTNLTDTITGESIMANTLPAGMYAIKYGNVTGILWWLQGGNPSKWYLLGRWQPISNQPKVLEISQNVHLLYAQQSSSTVDFYNDIPLMDLSGKADLIDGKVPEEQLPEVHSYVEDILLNEGEKKLKLVEDGFVEATDDNGNKLIISDKKATAETQSGIISGDATIVNAFTNDDGTESYSTFQSGVLKATLPITFNGDFYGNFDSNLKLGISVKRVATESPIGSNDSSYTKVLISDNDSNWAESIELWKRENGEETKIADIALGQQPQYQRGIVAQTNGSYNYSSAIVTIGCETITEKFNVAKNGELFVKLTLNNLKVGYFYGTTEVTSTTTIIQGDRNFELGLSAYTTETYNEETGYYDKSLTLTSEYPGNQVNIHANGISASGNNPSKPLEIIFGNLPTSADGLVSGQLWNDNGVLKIV